MADAKATDLDVGEVLNNTYRLDLLIGQGGMGRVFSATDLALHLRQVFIGVRETVGERVDRSVRPGRARFCAVRVRRQHFGVRRLAALSEDKGQRHTQRRQRNPLPSQRRGERQGDRQGER